MTQDKAALKAVCEITALDEKNPEDRQRAELISEVLAGLPEEAITDKKALLALKRNASKPFKTS